MSGATLGPRAAKRIGERSAEAVPSAPPPVRSGTVIRAVFGRGGKDRALRMTAEERAFLPAALEVIETPASPTLRLTALAICALLSSALVWSCVARIDEVAVAPGKVVPLGEVKVVQPLETAVIRAIHVDDGDHVAAGTPLIDLDPTEPEADLLTATYARGQAALDDEAARVLVEGNDDAPFAAPPGIDPGVVARTHRRAVEELGRHRAEHQGTEADIAEKRAELAANAAQIERETAILPLLQEKYDTAKGLFDKRYGPRPPVLDAEQQVAEHKAALEGAKNSAAEIEAQIRSLGAKQAQSDAAYLADALDRRAKAQDKLNGLDGDISKARQRVANRRLLAPVAGTVEAVKVHTPGAVVTSADVLMTIVPDGAGIEIDAGVDNKDIGFVREGQEVAIKVEAFPFTRYGLLHGSLRKVGRDAVSPGRPHDAAGGPGSEGPGGAGPPEANLAYPAKVTLARYWIMVDGKREPLQPGMRVEAEIKTGERRVIDYLLSPVRQAVQEAGRER